MSSLFFVIKNFTNLGVFSRLLLVLVKPLALWLSIKLDTDSGLALAQIYLIGLLFLSLSGTNAHRVFYKNYFGNDPLNSNFVIAKSYIEYIKKITLQLMLVILLSSLVASIIFWDTLGMVIIGILFGISEKLNDEFQRYAQFINNSLNLFYLAISKLLALIVAALLSYISVFDIWFVFPILLLIGSIAINGKTILSATVYFVKTTKKSFFGVIKMAYRHVRKDILQIGCVFMGITLVSIDKWLLQYLSITDLPTYMLYTQFASLFIVTQTIILIAPVRARLVNENPLEIKSIKIGSPIISFLPLIIAIGLYTHNDHNEGVENIGYFAFLFAAVVTFTVAYTERLYWAASAGIRFLLDAVILGLFISLIIVLILFWPISNLVVVSFGILFCLMCFRVLAMMYLLRNTKLDNS